MAKRRLPRDPKTIVDEQIKRWGLPAAGSAEAAAVPDKPRPLITVSREFGSQGAAVAKLVARRLGYTFWANEIVHAVSEATGARLALLATLDEQTRSGVDDFIAHLFTGAEGTSAEYVRQVGLVVQTLERQGSAVVVGRGGCFIARADRALRVRIVCPRQQRIRGYAERQGLSEKAAARKVDKIEKERRAFHKRYFNADIADPSHFDVVLSTGSLSLDAVGKLILASYLTKFPDLPPPSSRPSRPSQPGQSWPGL